MTSIRTYKRSKENHDTAKEAWTDIENRSELVDSFEQYRDRAHTESEWVFLVEVPDGS